VPEKHPPSSALLHPQLGEAHTDVDVVPGGGHDEATRPGDDPRVAVNAHPAFLVGDRLVLIPAGLQRVEELGLRLHHRVRVREGEIVGHHRADRGRVAGERGGPTSLVGGEDLLGVVVRPRREAMRRKSDDELRKIRAK
jgi:hypothetical protein